MHGVSAQSVKTFATAHRLHGLIEELKYAEALKILFSEHKNDVMSWVSLKSYLLHIASCHRELSVVSLLIECSSKDNLSQSSALIPGFK